MTCPFDAKCKEYNKLRRQAGTEKCNTCSKAKDELVVEASKSVSMDLTVFFESMKPTGDAGKAMAIINTLPPKYFTMIMQSTYRRMSQEDIARYHGISQSAVCKMLKRAKELAYRRFKG
ncbi:sigma-70 family RNA polymerase sigma factor [Candidatus Pacearchaeota archaeon]|nr:sigma-70 family RNA polymerase sigma factor [Candidatus Pacearchaeota archaeon]